MKYDVLFYGNLYSCPAGKRKPDCPVFTFENLSFIEKINWFDELTPEERKSIKEHHQCCVAKR